MLCKVCEKEFDKSKYNTTDCCDECNEKEIEISMIGFELNSLVEKINRNMKNMSVNDIRNVSARLASTAIDLRRML